MKSLPRALALFAVSGLLVVLPAGAESFSVVLVNGTVIESRYPAQPAPDDPDKLLLLTEWGNRIALRRADVREVRATGAEAGFGRGIDTRARFVGAAPNDAPVPAFGGGGSEARDLVGAVAEYLLRSSLAATEERLQRARANTVRHFGEPPVAGTDGGTGFLIGIGPATDQRSFVPQPATELDPTLLLVQGLVLPPTDPTQGWQPGQPTLVPLAGLAAAPPSYFWGKPPAD